MDSAKELLAARDTNDARPLAVATAHQTKGRGTRGRSWTDDGRGNVALTVAFPAPLPLTPVTLLPLRVGTVVIPIQAFPADVPSPGAAMGSGIWPGSTPPPIDDKTFNSKRFVFDPSVNPNPPVGDIAAFRAYFYPRYDRARQAHLLGVQSGQPAACPFQKILKFAQ